MSNPGAITAASTRAKTPALDTPIESESAPAAAGPLRRPRGARRPSGQTPILRGVDVEIPEGAFAVLVGPSGCGK